MKPAILHPAARAELEEAIDWYDEKQAGLGQELQNEIEAATHRIEQDPGIGARFQSTAYRFYRVKRFSYLNYYLEFASTVWIAAIAHGRRRPGYWRRRKP